MKTLQEHIDLMQKLRLPFKRQLAKMLLHIVREHTKEIAKMGDEDFLNSLIMGEPQLIKKPRTRKTRRKG